MTIMDWFLLCSIITGGVGLVICAVILMIFD